jgi:hypothetical protein
VPGEPSTVGEETAMGFTLCADPVGAGHAELRPHAAGGEDSCPPRAGRPMLEGVAGLDSSKTLESASGRIAASRAPAGRWP